MSPSTRQLFSFLKKFLRPYSGKVILATFLSAFSSAIGLYNAIAFAQVVDFAIHYTPGQSFDSLTLTFTLWLVVILARNAAVFLSKYIGIFTAEQAGNDASLFTVNHLSKLDIAWHEKENTGNKMKRIDRGAQSVVNLMKLWLNTILDVIVTGLGALYLIGRFDIPLAGALALYLAIYYTVSKVSRLRAVAVLHLANRKEEEFTGLFYEIIANIRSVKVLGMGEKIFEYARVITREYLALAKRRIFWFQAGGAGRGLIAGIAQTVFFSLIVFGIFNGRYEISFLILFYGYFNNLTNAIGALSMATDDLAVARTNINRMAELLDVPVAIDLEEGKQDFPAEWDALHIKDLSFAYGDNAALSGITLDIKKGEKVGIVGLSGAGKSTLFKLFLKEYENYEGEILIGTVPLRHIKKSSYVMHNAAVLQDTEVFNLSLRDNIVLANALESQNEALLERSMDIAHVKDFLAKLPQGLDTLIGEKGVKLSGGEKQRLGIARAVFKNPSILFLDEATSHLDVESEQKIQDSLKKFFTNVTAVVIAHRLSTIREMDRIIVIEHGKVIETGTFEALSSQSGRFREFWDKQRSL